MTLIYFKVSQETRPPEKLVMIAMYNLFYPVAVFPRPHSNPQLFLQNCTMCNIINWLAKNANVKFQNEKLCISQFILSSDVYQACRSKYIWRIIQVWEMTNIVANCHLIISDLCCCINTHLLKDDTRDWIGPNANCLFIVIHVYH